MTAVKSGLMIIDQRRAHIRILYERYLAQMADHHSYPQKLMFPEALHLTPADGNVLASVMTEMQSLGFELSDLGGNTYAVNAVPSGLEGVKLHQSSARPYSLCTRRVVVICSKRRRHFGQQR